jgi:uncharacterized protein YdaT
VKNKLSDLRNHLFETIERLKDEEKPMDVDRAKAVADVANAIINSAKVELRAIEVAGEGKPSEFLEIEEGETDRFLPEAREDLRRGLSTGKHLGRPA